MTAVPATASPDEVEDVPPGRARRALVLAAVYYVLGAVAVTLWLWRHPGTATVAGNPNDADQFAWFFRYDAAALAHGRLPALVTTALNAPTGVNAMWNTFMLLPGVLLAPLTLLAGPQASLNLLLTVGFAGSAFALFVVLRRWGVRSASAAVAGALYGFSPALLQSAVGHYDLMFAVLPPLIVDAALRVGLGLGRTGLGRARPGRGAALRGGLLLGALAAAQLLTAEELLLDSALATALIAVVLALSRPKQLPSRVRGALAGFAVAALLVLVVCGYPLWVQFFGPLHQHGSAFTPDFFKSDLAGFVTPSRLLLFHSAGSAAAAARYQGGVPEYLAYLGWPLLLVLAVIAVAGWRQLPVRAAAVTFAALAIFSLGGTLMIGGVSHPGVLLPWHWLGSLPLLNAVLPDRFSIVADGAAAALLAFGIDLARRQPWVARWSRGPTLVTAIAVLAVLPAVPRPLPEAAAVAPPSGWSASLNGLHLAAGARVLVVPIPTATFTEPMRWQAESGQDIDLIGGYFTGPGPGGQAYIGGAGVAPSAQYLNAAWDGGVSPQVPSRAEMESQLADWRPAAVLAVTGPRSALGTYLIGLLGPPSTRYGDVLAWRR
ncbi:MAG TPA: hypothetical protein VGI00_13090 [Streptosporangiaceae bacterium]